MYPFSSRSRAFAHLRRQKIAFSAVALALVLHQTPLPAAAYTAFPSAFIRAPKNTTRLLAPTAVITVSPGASGDTDDGLCSLVEAIHNANSDSTSGSPDCAPGTGADTVILPPAVTLGYVTTFGDSHTALPTITSPITIEANNSTIRRTGGGGFRLFNVASTGDLTLNSATVSGGFVSGAFGDGRGGGILVDGGRLTLTNSTVSGNVATIGGYRSASESDDPRERTIGGNPALPPGDGTGGGIALFNGTITLTNSTVSGNYASDNGGGLYLRNSTTTFINSTISGNTAFRGGGVYNRSSTTTFTNSTISGNMGYVGGGLNTERGTVTLTHSTISGNNGEGIYAQYDIVVLNHTLVSGNSGNEIRNTYATISADNYNVFGDSSESNGYAFSNFTPGATDITATSDGTAPTPLSGILAPLANNGGPTLTHALKAGSPAVDVTALPGVSPVTTDQRGVVRPEDNDGDTIPEYDVGAYEGALLPPVPVPILVAPSASGDVDNGQCSLVEAIQNANGDDTSGSPDCAPGSGADLIELPPNETFSYSTAFGPQTALPLITDTDGLTINGNNSTIRRTPGSPAFRIMGVAYGASLTLNESTISGGAAAGLAGGGIVSNGNLTLNHSTISNNQAQDGGALSFGGATLSVNHSTISGNSASRGGGMSVSAYGGTITVTNSTLSGNTATSQGGGVFAQTSTVTVTDSRIENNRGTFGGGGVTLESGTLTLTGSTIRNNSGNNGGGLENVNGTATLINSTISSNLSYSGAGLFQSNGSLTVTHSTITGNTALWSGGALHNTDGTVTLNRSILSGNVSTFNVGHEIYNASFYYYRPLAGTIHANNFNVFGAGNIPTSNAFANFTPGPTDITATSDGSDPTPLSGILAPLANNGGPTLTHALVGGGPAVDVTSSAGVPPVSTDQRGVTRPADGDGDSVPEFDAGAFEGVVMVVTPGASGDVDNGQCSLVEAIQNANGNDTSGSIDCAPGNGNDTIQLPTGATFSYSTAFGPQTALPYITDGDGLTIKGNNSTIDRTSGSPVFRIMRVNAGATLTLQDTTLSGGQSYESGAGILNYGTLTLTSSTISGNSANFAGGVATLLGETTIATSTISGNSAGNSGGGLYFYASTVSVINSTISDNSANDGGGLMSSFGTTLTVTNSTISGNSAFSSGGGLYFRSSTASLTNSTISGNSTTYTKGGGLFSFLSTASVTNSTISGNSAGASGGGLYSFLGATTITHSTISGNSTFVGGGGIYAVGDTMVLNRNVISGNRSVYLGEEIRANSATISTDGFNVFGDSSNTNAEAFGYFTPSVGDITATSDGTDPTPLSGILAPLGLNGGATRTHALVPHSPALDVTADPGSLLPPSPTTDQRGMLRPTDGDGNSLAEYDAGAYEAEPALTVTLAEFQAIAQSDHIRVTWETAQETDNLGFNLYRFTDPAQAGERLNGELIPSQVPGGGGAFYAFPDANVNDGDTYYYTLESVSLTGQTALHGSVSATFFPPTAIEIGEWRAESGENNVGVWAGMMAGMAAVAAWMRRRIKRKQGK